MLEWSKGLVTGGNVTLFGPCFWQPATMIISKVRAAPSESSGSLTSTCQVPARLISTFAVSREKDTRFLVWSSLTAFSSTLVALKSVTAGAVLRKVTFKLYEGGDMSVNAQSVMFLCHELPPSALNSGMWVSVLNPLLAVKEVRDLFSCHCHVQPI